MMRRNKISNVQLVLIGIIKNKNNLAVENSISIFNNSFQCPDYIFH